MATSHPITDPVWPPPEGAYDYVATLNDAELAWEFLRRNVAYRKCVVDAVVTTPMPARLPTGQMVWPYGDPQPAAARWDLHSFR